MALLTAEDVLNKAFSKTKYREGFDQDEVDDFLDEVASTIATLTAERDEYAARLSQAQAGGAVAPMAAAPAQAAAPASGGIASGTSLLQAATDPNPPSATSMLSMAQKLHDDYVTAGEAEKERIIAEARVEADSLLQRAERDAQGKLTALEGERADLERKIDDLRRFERDYRTHLKSFLENLLGDLEHGAQKGDGGGSSSGAMSRPAVTETFRAEQPAPAPVRPPEPAPAPEPAQAPPSFMTLAPNPPATGPVPEWPSQGNPQI